VVPQQLQQVAVVGGSSAATPDLLLKHPNETFYNMLLRQMKHLKYASETLAKNT
jgi:uncharacterized protein YaeQ